MKIKLGVIFGGESVEHEVSIISAVQAMNKIDQEKYDIIPTKTLTKTASTGFNLNEKIKIDYEKYNELANFYGENTFCLKEKYYICLE